MKVVSGALRFRLFLPTILLLAGSSALATTVRIPTDEELVCGARAIVRGRVLSVECAMDGERIYTYITLRVQEVLKGNLASRKIVIKEEGGEFAGRGSLTWGTPQFTPDENVLLYLTTRNDGSLRVYDMFLGKFNIIEDKSSGGEWVSRSAPDAKVIIVNSQTNQSEATERLELKKYKAMIRGKIALTRERFEEFEEAYFRDIPLRSEPAEYQRQKSKGSLQPQFRFIRSADPSRWFEPDDNQPISFTVNPDGAPNPQVIDDIVAAMNVWSNVSGSAMRVTYAGTTNDCFPHGSGNTMVFNNCDNAFAQTPNCATIIALGSINWDTHHKRSVNGVNFSKIIQGHISFNPYSACSYDNHCNIQEIVTHELGHTLGLGHSQDPAATMAGTAHFDGRCASIREDDEAGMRFIYPAPGTSGSQLRIYTDALPDSYLNVNYEHNLLAGGGVPNFTWSLVSGGGSLPTGFLLLPSGLIRGTPAQTGSYTFTVRVQDATQATAEKTLTLTIAAEQPQYASQFVSQSVAVNVQAGQTFSANLKWNNSGVQAWDGFNGCKLVSLNPAGNTNWGGDSVSLGGLRIESGRQLDMTFTAQAPRTGGTYNFQWQLYQDGVGAFGQPSANIQINVVGNVEGDPNIPSITSPTSFDAKMLTAFSQQLSVAGGTAPYIWSIVAGALPSGMSLNQVAGVISGTPTSVGGSTFTVQVADSLSHIAQKQITINVRPSQFEITTISFPTATVTTNFSAALVANGGAAPYAWSIVTGALPTGISLNTSTGVISGTPTSIGTASFTVQAQDGQSAIAQRAFLLTVNPLPVTITTPSLPTNVLVRANYSMQLAASGGVAPYTWSIVNGALPAGITLNPATGSLTGTATVAGAFTFTVEMKDAGGYTVRKDFSINVIAVPLAIERATAGFEVMKGAGFSYQVIATGGMPSYAWLITQGSLPAGLTLNPATGLISGTPTTAGAYNAVITVRDQKPTTVTATLQIKVIDPNSIALVTRAKYKAGKKMLQIFGERFEPAAVVMVDGIQVTAKFSDAIFVIKRFPLAAGSHQIVIINPNSIASQAYVLNIE
jgi:hypothetical protein